ncbi:hypothetical protein GDO81_014307 [Engystomops pustulosus]|uniref:Uncharacterized protein n=1 Tax=Engystomops pustulosus TaxID=76066 RepID=A0AAV7BA38_ENGPU|nr:hypothetical protein GDO81_014307 [Engystomops pustulosus]
MGLAGICSAARFKSKNTEKHWHGWSVSSGVWGQSMLGLVVQQFFMEKEIFWRVMFGLGWKDGHAGICSSAKWLNKEYGKE